MKTRTLFHPERYTTNRSLKPLYKNQIKSEITLIYPLFILCMENR